MQFEYSPYILPLCAAALVSVIVAGYAWTRRTTPSAQSLAFLALTIAVWSFGYALEIAGANLETKYFWGIFQYIGISFVPYFWLIFAIRYSDPQRALPRWFLACAALIPSVTILLALSTQWHGLVWSEFQLKQHANFSALQISHGAWFWIHSLYSYLLMLAGTLLLARVIWQRQGLYRGQALALLVAVLAPWLGNALYLSGNSPLPYLDVTPFAFTISVTVLAWAVFGFHLIDVTPLARDRVIDSMQDGMIVLDRRGYIADINPAAARIIGVPAALALGKSGEDVFAPWQQLLDRFRDIVETDQVIVIGEGNAARRFQIRVSPLREHEQIVGRVLLLHALDEEKIIPRAVPSPLGADVNDSPAAAPAAQIPLWSALVTFFKVPVKPELQAPPGVEPTWYIARERIFTMIVRLTAAIGTVSLIFTAHNVPTGADWLLPYSAILMVLWVLGLARNFNFDSRALVFLTFLYVLGLVELVNFGFSVECFVFFMCFVLTAIVLTSRRGAIIAFTASFITLGAFAVLVGSGTFVPFVTATESKIPAPPTVQEGLNSLAIFAAGTLAVLIATIILLENLQTAREKERQSLKLLQVERDLLDRRVTERTRALAESNTKYQTLVEQLPVVVYRYATDGANSDNYMSPRIETMLGYPRSAWENDTELWQKALHAQDRENALASIGETRAQGKAIVEYRLLARDRRVVWVRDNAAVVRDEYGQPQFVQGVLEDITAQKRAEEQVRKLSQAVEQSGSSIVITDINGNIEYVNPQFTRATGYTLEEVAGQNPRLLKSGKQDTAFYKEMWQTITTGKTWRGTFCNKRKDDSLYWEAATITPVLDAQGALTHYIAIKEDITHQKEMEDALKQAYQQQSVLNSLLSQSLGAQTLEEMLERALEIILTIPWLAVQPRGGIFLVEDQPDVLVLKTKRNLDDSLITLCAGVPFGHCLCGRAAANAKIEFADCVDERHEIQFDGMKPHGHYSVPILFHEQVLGVLVLYLDSGRVRDAHETAFLEAIASVLASMIRDKQAEQTLARARDQALEASTFKSQLLSRVSHEMVTPLSGVIGYAELLQLDEFGALNESQREAAALIANSARYLNFMIHDLLDEAQIKAHTIVLRNQPFAPAALLDQVRAVTGVLAHTKGLSLQTEIAPDLPLSLSGDEQRLQQILVNLIGNAIKFTKRGVVHVRLARAPAGQWTMQVTDTGAGIPPEAQLYIFEPFRQVDNSITRVSRGSGLGLSITKQLVELMGGHITLESQENIGSVFTVILPLQTIP